MTFKSPCRTSVMCFLTGSVKSSCTRNPAAFYWRFYDCLSQNISIFQKQALKVCCIFGNYSRGAATSLVVLCDHSLRSISLLIADRNLPAAITLLSQSPTVVNAGRPLKMAAELHPRSGKLIGLSNSNRTARRNQPVQEFNHGLVLSKEPLRDRDVFTVRIDKKVNNSRPVSAAASPERLWEQRDCGSWRDEPGSVSVRSEGLLLLRAAHTAWQPPQPSRVLGPVLNTVSEP